MYSDWLVMIKDGRIRGNAPPKEIVTAENIKSLYGVNVAVSEEFGVPHIILNRLP